MRRLAPAALALAGLAACSGPAETPNAPRTVTPGPAASSAAGEPSPSATSPATPSATPETHEFVVVEHESFNEPWALAFLPGTDTMAVTERGGAVKLRDPDGTVRDVSGVPDLVAAGQGGLGDLIPGPTFADDGTVYLSWVERGDGGTGAVVGRGTLDVAAAELADVDVIWEQTPKVDGDGHFSHRLLIHDDHLFVSSGDRQNFDPAQAMDGNLGKIVRLTLDGDPAPDNPWAGEGGVAAQFWSIGHRNPLGLAADGDGRLWGSEMGPQGGDELNLVQPGLNYGWPEASNGSHYGGREIPDHADGDGFEPPKAFWTPSISPGSLMIYDGELFPAWKGDAFVGALSGEALVRIDLDGETASQAENWPMGARIRGVAEAPDGAIWLLEDGSGGRLLELTPA